MKKLYWWKRFTRASRFTGWSRDYFSSTAFSVIIIVVYVSLWWICLVSTDSLDRDISWFSMVSKLIQTTIFGI